MKKVVLVVLATHAALLAVLVLHHLASPGIAPQPMIVRTLAAPQPPAPPLRTSPPRAAPAKASFPKTSRPSRASSPGPPSQHTLLSQLSKNLSSLTSSSSSPVRRNSSALPIPQHLSKRPAITIEHPPDLTYAQLLTDLLQQALELPEFGAVKASLTILPNGTLRSCDIVTSQSEKNSDFLKNRLPELLFPCFNDAETKTLTLVFRNVEHP